MPDNFEKAKDEILLRTEGNGGPSNRDMLRAMGALAQDVDELIDGLDKKQKARHDETVEAFDRHLVEATTYDQRISVIEQWRTESSLTCVSKVREIAAEVAAELHGPTHAAHMLEHHREPKRREDDAAHENHRNEREGEFPTGDQRTLFEMMLGWSILKWLVAGVVMVGITATISYTMSSCAAERVERDAVQNGVEMHFDPSPSP